MAKTVTIESGFARPEGGWGAGSSLTSSSLLLPDVETVGVAPPQPPAHDDDDDDDDSDESESSSLPSESSGIFYR